MVDHVEQVDYLDAYVPEEPMSFAWANGNPQRALSDAKGIKEEALIQKEKEILSDLDENKSIRGKTVRPKLRRSFRAKSRPKHLNLLCVLLVLEY